MAHVVLVSYQEALNAEPVRLDYSSLLRTVLQMDPRLTTRITTFYVYQLAPTLCGRFLKEIRTMAIGPNMLIANLSKLAEDHVELRQSRTIRCLQ